MASCKVTRVVALRLVLEHRYLKDPVHVRMGHHHRDSSREHLSNNDPDLHQWSVCHPEA